MVINTLFLVVMSCLVTRATIQKPHATHSTVLSPTESFDSLEDDFASQESLPSHHSTHQTLSEQQDNVRHQTHHQQTHSGGQRSHMSQPQGGGGSLLDVDSLGSSHRDEQRIRSPSPTVAESNLPGNSY